ncbi:MAG: GTP cyclohydrolase I FolE [Elusimicrobia bacterium]|nr:GTP cyclohydrolase I FolE [Elusimicrobiota bacterium]
METKTRSIPDVVRELISLIGEDPSRLGLKKTPERFAKAISELTSGYNLDTDAIVNGAVYPAEGNSGLILVRDISFHSLCEHHLLPFHGKAYVAYMPDEKIIGLSKIPRIVQVFARRLQLQERLTRQIAQAVETKLNPLGVGVIVKARHMCLEMRGAKAAGSEMVTSVYLGKFKDCSMTRSEFLNLIANPPR